MGREKKFSCLLFCGSKNKTESDMMTVKKGESQEKEVRQCLKLAN